MRLHVNVDHIATLRNARGTPYPDPVRGAELCLDAGAHGITAHLREDRRHIVDADVFSLSSMLRARACLFNLEAAATDEMVEAALSCRPKLVTFVPEKREEKTTEGGLDVSSSKEKLLPKIARLKEHDIEVSLFIAPVYEQIDASVELGITQIELHTGEYAHLSESLSQDSSGIRAALEAKAHIFLAAEYAHKLGLKVAAGHGLTSQNVEPLADCKWIQEMNVGHSIIADSVFCGLEQATKRMLAAINKTK